MAIMGALRESPRGMTVITVARAVGLNRHSAAKYLEALVAAGQVDMKSFGRSKVFRLSDRVPVASMMSYSADIILTLDRDLRVVYANDRLLAATGLSRNELLSKNIENFPFILRVEPPVLPFLRDAINGRPGSAEVFDPGRSGGRYYLARFVPTTFENGGTGATVIMTEITDLVQAKQALQKEHDALEARVQERTAALEQANRALKAEIRSRRRAEKALRDSEEKYRSLAEEISDVVWEIDTQGRFTYISPRVRDMLGYEPAEFLGKTIMGFLSPHHENDITKDFDKVFGRPESYVLQETYVLHKDGHEVVVEANGTAMFDEDGRFTGYRGLIRDVTARHVTRHVKRKK